MIAPCGGFLTSIMIWINLQVFSCPSLANSPPKLITQEEGSFHRVLPVGSTVQLTCPVEADSRDHLFFDWYKDKEPLTTFGDSRIRVLPSGSLRIKDAVIEDTGLYICRAVNGFGSVEVNTTLIVLDDSEEGENDDVDAIDPQKRNLYPGVDGMEGKLQTAARPRLVHVTKLHRTTMQRPIGSSVRFRCVASGHPSPQIAWLKNNREVSESFGHVKRGRWSLYLQDMAVSDSGNYTCVVHNQYGVVNHTFPIEIVDRMRGKPEMTGIHPLNTTVEIGESATLQCSVHSDIPPHVQWVKQVESMDPGLDLDIIKVEGESYRVMQPSEVSTKPGGYFVAKLVISQAKENDAGKYICLGANTLGYSHRAAYLSVLSRPPSSQATPFPIVLTVVTAVGVAMTLLLALCFYLRKQHRGRRPRSTSRRVAMESKELFLSLSSDRSSDMATGSRKPSRTCLSPTPSS